MTGFPLESPVPSLTLFTDASLLGCGAYLEGQTVSGMWSSTVQKDHINLLEMRAVLLALSHFNLCLESLSIVLATDNTTDESGRNTLLLSVSAGQGCSDPMLSIPDSSGCETYSRLSERSCGLSFQVLSTSQYRVGTSSGSFSVYSSSLGKSQYRSIRNESDLQGDNFRLPNSRPQSLCCGRNEPILGGNVRLCNPPFRFLAPVLHKITGEKCRIIVIAPAWPKQAWFANLLRLSCARPLVLPLKRNLLSQFKGDVVHLSPERLHLHAWFLSRIISDRKAFLKQLPSTSPGQCENPLASSMMQGGKSSLIGVLEGRLIHSKSLSNN